MKNSLDFTRYVFVIIMVLVAACTTDKNVEHELVTEGTYVYMFMAKFSGTPEEVSQLKQDIDTMLSNIPDIIDMVSGLQDSEDAKYNFGLTVRFKDKAAREAYTSNPYHVALGDQYRGSPIVGETTIVEYWVAISP